MTIEEVIKAVTGKTPLENMDSYVNEWLSWYKGDVLAFHHYTVLTVKRK